MQLSSPKDRTPVQVVFFNGRGDSKGVAQASRQAQVKHIKVTHIRGDPLDQTDMGEKLDIATWALLPRRTPLPCMRSVHKAMRSSTWTHVR